MLPSRVKAWLFYGLFMNHLCYFLGSLRFITKRAGENETLVWMRHGTQGNKWRFADLTFRSQSPLQVFVWICFIAHYCSTLSILIYTINTQKLHWTWPLSWGSLQLRLKDLTQNNAKMWNSRRIPIYWHWQWNVLTIHWGTPFTSPSCTSQFIIEAEIGGRHSRGGIAVDDIDVWSSTTGSCPAERECTFQSSLCGLQPQAQPDLSWNRTRGTQPANSSGPASDHTLGTEQGEAVPQCSLAVMEPGE